MRFFRTSPYKQWVAQLRDTIKSPIPTEHFDTAKRYDIYCAVAGEYRLYANVRLISRKTFNDIQGYGSAYPSFLEIENADGIRTMVPEFPIHAICEHGVKHDYVVLGKTTDSKN